MFATRPRTKRISSPNSEGMAYPTVSGMLIVVAPASIAASTTVQRNSQSDRNASSAENSTSRVRELACRTAATARLRISSRVVLNFFWMWMSLVAMKVWIRGRAAWRTASQQRSMSAGTARARPAMTGPRTSRAMRLTASKSPSDATGKPASMMSTPSRASWRARVSFSVLFIEKPGDCSPSRNVVSKIRICRLTAAVPPCAGAGASRPGFG
jgi:hypothetical protein